MQTTKCLNSKCKTLQGCADNECERANVSVCVALLNAALILCTWKQHQRWINKRTVFFKVKLKTPLNFQTCFKTWRYSVNLICVWFVDNIFTFVKILKIKISPLIKGCRIYNLTNSLTNIHEIQIIKSLYVCWGDIEASSFHTRLV